MSLLSSLYICNSWKINYELSKTSNEMCHAKDDNAVISFLKFSKKVSLKNLYYFFETQFYIHEFICSISYTLRKNIEYNIKIFLFELYDQSRFSCFSKFGKWTTTIYVQYLPIFYQCILYNNTEASSNKFDVEATFLKKL